MAMRITTKMMQTRSLNNINTNKSLKEKLTTQLSTGKKITRPSDDPIVAIRALKLNSSLNKVTQYYEKNSKDAESWLDLTESALDTTSTILTNMKQYLTQTVSNYYEATDKSAILENLSNFIDEIYATGNADSAGRSIFTGYRTGLPLTFTEDKEEKYSITEQWTNSCLDMVNFVKTGDLSEINKGNFNDKKTTEYDVENYDIARIRLAYDDLDIDTTKSPVEAEVNLSFLVKAKETQETINGNVVNGVTVNTTSYSMFVQTDAGANSDELKLQITDANGNITNAQWDFASNSFIYTDAAGTVTTAPAGLNLSYSANNGSGSLTIEESGNAVKTTTLGFTIENNTYKFDDTYKTDLTITDKFAAATDEAYETAHNNPDAIVYIAETGELLLGENIRSQLSALSADSEIRVTYEKSDWQKGDLDPIHYFYTERENDKGNKIVYNEDKLEGIDSEKYKQIMEYDIGSNQTIRVNTTADEVFTHDMGRDIAELKSMLEEYQTLSDTYDTVKKLVESGDYTGDELTKLNQQLNALSKACTMAKEKAQQKTESLQTTFGEYVNQVTQAITDVGSRESRLTLIQNRLGAQQTNFSELVSENEDADITELAIQLSSVQLTYEAALSSISYVMKTSLLDFI